MSLLDSLGKMEVDHEVGAQLLDDFERSAELFNADQENQFLRRTVIRTALAFVEGTNNFLKRAIYDYHERNVRPTHHTARVLCLPPMHRMFERIQSESELLLLIERVASLDGDGNVRLKEAFQPMVASIRFMFRMAAAVYRHDFSPDFAAHGWCDLQKAIQIRNRLTHPKTSADLIVADDEIQIVQRGMQWFLDNAGMMMQVESREIEAFHASIGAYLRTLTKEKFLALKEANGGWGDEGPPSGFEDLNFPLKDHYPDA